MSFLDKYFKGTLLVKSAGVALPIRAVLDYIGVLEAVDDPVTGETKIQATGALAALLGWLVVDSTGAKFVKTIVAPTVGISAVKGTGSNVGTPILYTGQQVGTGESGEILEGTVGGAVIVRGARGGEGGGLYLLGGDGESPTRHGGNVFIGAGYFSTRTGGSLTPLGGSTGASVTLSATNAVDSGGRIRLQFSWLDRLSIERDGSYLVNDTEQQASWDSASGFRPLRGPFIHIRPSGGDDYAAIQDALTLSAALGGVVLFEAGNYQSSAVITCPSGSRAWGNPEATLVSTLAPSDGFSNALFAATHTTTGPNSTVATQPAIGSYTIEVVDDVFAPGDHIVVQGEDNVAQTFRVLSKVTTTLTLDAPVAFTLAAGKAVDASDIPSDIQMIGNGMVITGTGDRAFEFACTQRCLVKGWRITRAAGSFTAMCASFDVGGRGNTFADMWVDGGGVSTQGLALECQVNSTIRDSFVSYVGSGAADCGIYVATSVGYVVENVRTHACYAGISLQPSSVGDVQACMHGVVSDSTFLDSTTYGVICGDGSDLAFERVDASRSIIAGFAFTPNSSLAGCHNALLTDCAANDCGSGLLVGAGTVLLAKGLTTDRCTYGIDMQTASAATRCMVSGWAAGDNATTGRAGTVFPWRVSAGLLDVSDAYVYSAVNGNWYSEILGGTVRLSGMTAEVVGSPTGAKILTENSGASVLELERVRTVGTFGVGVYAAFAVAAKIRRGDGVDLSSCTTAWTIDATARANFGQVTLNGATPVAVAGYFLADAPISLSWNTTGGTPGAQPVLTAKAANSFSVKGTAGDTSTYDWKVA